MSPPRTVQPWRLTAHSVLARSGSRVIAKSGSVDWVDPFVGARAIDPAGNVWVMNNWQDTDSCFGTPPEPLSTLCGGQGVVIFYGMAKPVRAPQIGPAQAP